MPDPGVWAAVRMEIPNAGNRAFKILLLVDTTALRSPQVARALMCVAVLREIRDQPTEQVAGQGPEQCVLCPSHLLPPGRPLCLAPLGRAQYPHLPAGRCNLCGSSGSHLGPALGTWSLFSHPGDSCPRICLKKAESC